MQTRRFFDPAQPQTLQGAVLFCYLNAAFSLFYLALGAALPLILIVAAVGAYGIANDRKWGYRLAVVAASIYVVGQAIAFVTFEHNLNGILVLAFAILLIVLLLHPQSRHYQRIWFK
ncbi:MAG TPA: hypothetical protein VN781_06980 [Acidimicrobiales bacterium]|nr:hypothetical protein [Acidimicrobiales bacterium]